MGNEIETSLILPVTPEFIERRILVVRGIKVMLGNDLAELYQVEPRTLIQAIKRNKERFPSDFVFQLTVNEAVCLKSQFVISNVDTPLRYQIGTSNIGRGGRRHPPYVFTELGIAMLSSVLRSGRAVQMNIFIMRAFVKLREMLATHKDLAQKIDELEKTQKSQGDKLIAVFSLLKRLSDEPQAKTNPIGFGKQ
jgi:hypothetical protein